MIKFLTQYFYFKYSLQHHPVHKSETEFRKEKKWRKKIKNQFEKLLIIISKLIFTLRCSYNWIIQTGCYEIFFFLFSTSHYYWFRVCVCIFIAAVFELLNFFSFFFLSNKGEKRESQSKNDISIVFYFQPKKVRIITAFVQWFSKLVSFNSSKCAIWMHTREIRECAINKKSHFFHFSPRIEKYYSMPIISGSGFLYIFFSWMHISWMSQNSLEFKPPPTECRCESHVLLLCNIISLSFTLATCLGVRKDKAYDIWSSMTCAFDIYKIIDDYSDDLLTMLNVRSTCLSVYLPFHTHTFTLVHRCLLSTWRPQRLPLAYNNNNNINVTIKKVP